GWEFDLFIAYLVRTLIRASRMRRSRSWSISPANVASMRLLPGGLGCPTTELVYTYSMQGHIFGGIDEKPFLSDDSAAAYVLRFAPGRRLVVRVRPEEPDVSVLRERDQDQHAA